MFVQSVNALICNPRQHFVYCLKTILLLSCGEKEKYLNNESNLIK